AFARCSAHSTRKDDHLVSSSTVRGLSWPRRDRCRETPRDDAHRALGADHSTEQLEGRHSVLRLVEQLDDRFLVWVSIVVVKDDPIGALLVLWLVDIIRGAAETAPVRPCGDHGDVLASPTAPDRCAVQDTARHVREDQRW